MFEILLDGFFAARHSVSRLVNKDFLAIASLSPKYRHFKRQQPFIFEILEPFLLVARGPNIELSSVKALITFDASKIFRLVNEKFIDYFEGLF